MSEITPKIAEAKYVGDYRIWLRFADGVEGEVDLEPELWGEIFEPLKDKALFARFQLYPERSTIFWPNDADLAPEFLYEKAIICPKGKTSRGKEAPKYFVAPAKGGWIVKKASVERTSGPYRTQAEALSKAKQMARSTGEGGILVQAKTGRFREIDPQPLRSRGRLTAAGRRSAKRDS